MKAVIPATGLGTRYLLAATEHPKGKVPVADRPAIHWAVEDAIAAGVTDLLIITGGRSGRGAIRRALRSTGGTRRPRARRGAAGAGARGQLHVHDDRGPGFDRARDNYRFANSRNSSSCCCRIRRAFASRRSVFPFFRPFPIVVRHAKRLVLIKPFGDAPVPGANEPPRARSFDAQRGHPGRVAEGTRRAL